MVDYTMELANYSQRCLELLKQSLLPLRHLVDAAGIASLTNHGHAQGATT